MSIDDRDYFREGSEARGAALVVPMKWVAIGLTAAAFLAFSAVENAVQHDGERLILHHLALSLDGVLRGELWQPLTYLLLHAGLAHLAWNMYALYIFATVLEERQTAPEQWRLYLLGGLSGAAACLLWSAAGLPGGERPVVGASGAVTALVVAAALHSPGKKVGLLFLPVPVWVVGSLFVGMDVVAAIVQAFDPSASGNVAAQAHLGGAIAGIVAMRAGWMGLRRGSRAAGRVPCPECGKPIPRTAAACSSCGWEKSFGGAPAPDPETARVDALLERIQTSGIGSLTQEERDYLNRAAARLRERKR